MRMVPPYSDQAKVWVELLKYFQFKKVIFLGGSDQEGRAILSRFQNLAEDADIEVMSTVVNPRVNHCEIRQSVPSKYAIKVCHDTNHALQ